MMYVSRCYMIVLGAWLFATIFLQSCSSVNGKPQPRVLGGRDADDSDYPYIASLRVSGFHKCGGSIVSERWILTAAHCLTKYTVRDLIIVVGTNNIRSGGRAYRVEELSIHPNYTQAGHANDIGLIKIVGRIEYTDTIQPIALPTKDVDETNCIGMFTGWGNSAVDVVNSDQLQEIALTVIETSLCHSIFGSVGRGQICTFTTTGEGICYGDSGSPLVADGVQIALASWGSPCARGYPDVHTRIYYFVDWIKSIID